MNSTPPEIVDLALEKSIQRAIGLGEALTEAQKQRILEARARALAQPIAQTREGSRDTIRVMSFHLAGETYAFPAASVTAVSKSIAITPVPCVPSFVCGITNQRGHIRSVVRLAQFLGLGQGEADDYVVVAQHDDMEVVFLVTNLDEVTDIAVTDIKPRPLNTNTKANPYIAGVVPGGLILLDLPSIFMDDRFIVNDEVI
jgi:purine-binding chemotaxis protein CheW